MSDILGIVERVVATVTATSDRGTATAVVRETRATVSAAALQGVAGPPGPASQVPGPPGPPGPAGGAPVPYAITAAASFTAAHGLSFAPETWVVTATGEILDTDTIHTPGVVTVMFAQPFTGTLYVR